MKIFKKKDGEFSLKKMLKNVKYSIKNITEIRPNVIVLFLIETLGSSCFPDGYQYYISLYDLQNNKYKILNNNFSWNDEYEKYKINHFLKIDNYLFAKYENCLHIYDIEQNMKFINETDYKIINERRGKKEKALIYKIPFEYFKIELINNFILVKKRDDKSFVYKYEDKLFKECQEFPFNLEDAGIMKLKNDDLIVCSYSEMKIYKKKDGEYSLKRKLKNVKYWIKNIIEIKPNTIVLFLIEILGNGCMPDGYQYYISLYDLQNNKYKILNDNFSHRSEYEKYKINRFWKIDKYLFAKYENYLDIYDI
jgi:hypothetical protein